MLSVTQRWIFWACIFAAGFALGYWVG